MTPSLPGGGDPAPGEHLGDRLSSMLDGEMTPDEMAAAQLHVERCPTCERELESVRATRQLLRRLDAPRPPESFVPALVRRHRRLTLFVAAVCVAAGVVAALVFTLMSPREDVSPPVGRFERIHSTSTPSPDPITEMAPLGVPAATGP